VKKAMQACEKMGRLLRVDKGTYDDIENGIDAFLTSDSPEYGNMERVSIQIKGISDKYEKFCFELTHLSQNKFEARESRVKYIEDIIEQKDYWIDHKAAARYIFYFQKTNKLCMFSAYKLQSVFRKNIAEFFITKTDDKKQRALAIISVNDLENLMHIEWLEC
jgi:hypothetical protein